LLEKMATYCMADVALCREALIHAIENPSFPDVEFEIVNHTAQINLRGVRVGAERVTNLLDTLRVRRDAELGTFARTYPFDTTNINKTKRVLAFVLEHFGVTMTSLDRKKDEFTKAVEGGGALATFLMTRARLQALSKGIKKATAFASIPGGRAYGVLRYYGAHTGRFSAGGRDAEKVNLHGLGKGNELLKLPELGLERSVIVPEEGSLFCAADLSTIEARVVAWLAAETELLERFRSGDDVYAWFAGLIFPGVEIHKKGPNAHLRALGKEALLGLGFGMGLATFIRQVRAKQIACEVADIERAYATYQASFPRIKALRKGLMKAFERTARAGWPVESTLWKMLRAESEGDSAPTVAIALPTGRTLYYRSARIEQEWTDFGLLPAVWFAPNFGGKGKPAPERIRFKRRRFEDGVVRDRLTPQVIVENVVQAIARDVMAHQALELEGLGLSVAWHAHDEVVSMCPRCSCATPCSPSCSWRVAGEMLKEVMSRVPATLPRLAGLPVACEVSLSIREAYAA
jgi:DNA polymerase bacteriophage-type